jgi:hypothetical protein
MATRPVLLHVHVTFDDITIADGFQDLHDVVGYYQTALGEFLGPDVVPMR